MLKARSEKDHMHQPAIRKSGFWADLPCRGHSWWGCSHQIVCTDCGAVLKQSLRRDCPELHVRVGAQRGSQAAEAVEAGMADLEGDLPGMWERSDLSGGWADTEADRADEATAEPATRVVSDLRVK